MLLYYLFFIYLYIAYPISIFNRSYSLKKAVEFSPRLSNKIFCIERRGFLCRFFYKPIRCRNKLHFLLYHPLRVFGYITHENGKTGLCLKSVLPPVHCFVKNQKTGCKNWILNLLGDVTVLPHKLLTH